MWPATVRPLYNVAHQQKAVFPPTPHHRRSTAHRKESRQSRPLRSPVRSPAAAERRPRHPPAARLQRVPPPQHRHSRQKRFETTWYAYVCEVQARRNTKARAQDSNTTQLDTEDRQLHGRPPYVRTPPPQRVDRHLSGGFFDVKPTQEGFQRPSACNCRKNNTRDKTLDKTWPNMHSGACAESMSALTLERTRAPAVNAKS